MQAGFCMRQDSAFSISNCNAPGCSNPYSHLSVSSIRPPSIHLRYRNTPSSTPQRSFPSAHCPNSSPFATCFEPWNAPQAIPYKADKGIHFALVFIVAAAGAEIVFRLDAPIGKKAVFRQFGIGKRAADGHFGYGDMLAAEERREGQMATPAAGREG